MPEIRRLVRRLDAWAAPANRNFQDGTTGWTDASTTAAGTGHFTSATHTVTGGDGTKSLRMHGTASPATELTLARTASALRGIEPGKTYAVEVACEIAAQPDLATAFVRFAWQDATGAAISNSDSAPLTAVGTDTLTLIATAPASAARVNIELRHQADTNTGDLDAYWDNVRFREIVLDLNDGVKYETVRDSFQIQQGGRGQALAATSSRYGGQEIVGETHENDKAVWQAVVAGANVDEVLDNCEAIVAASENAVGNDLAIEWRPSSASAPTFYPVRGPAEFNLTHSAVRLENGLAEYVDLSFPIAPLAEGEPQARTIAATTFPAVVQLADAVPGAAAAKMDLATRWNQATFTQVAIPWMLLAWAKRPLTPQSGSVAPFGIIEGESDNAGDRVNASTTADTDARGGTRWTSAAMSGAGNSVGTWTVDPSTMEPDPFTRGTIDIEVWARIKIAADVGNPKMQLSLVPAAGTGYGQARYTAEYGVDGKKIVNQATAGNTKFRPVRLGTLTMPVDRANPALWKLRIENTWTASGSGVFSIDYLVLVPARQRACGRTGTTPGTTSYAHFVQSTADTTKLIRSDLSGLVATSSSYFAGDAGLGGSPLELPAGNVDLLVWPSTLVPDDPTAVATDMAEEHTGVTGNVYITPRYYLVR